MDKESSDILRLAQKKQALDSLTRAGHIQESITLLSYNLDGVNKALNDIIIEKLEKIRDAHIDDFLGSWANAGGTSDFQITKVAQGSASSAEKA